MSEVVRRPGSYEFEITEKCHFKARGCGTCGKAKTNAIHKKGGGCKFVRVNGCAHCGKPKNSFDHMGATPSLNAFGSGNPIIFAALKKRWEELLIHHISLLDLPAESLKSVSVTVTMIFPDRQKRDEGNCRFFIEKTLGDALVSGGWLIDDSFWPEARYMVGPLQAEHRPGVTGMKIWIFPED